MANVLVQTTLLGTDTNPLTDLTDQQVEAIKALIQQYIPGAGQVIKGIRPPGDESFPIPCVQIQAGLITPKMYALQKWQTHTTINIIYYQGDDNPEACDQKATDLNIIFRKLFSQNALNDYSTAATLKFKSYSTPPSGQSGWLNSEMSRIEKGPLLKFWGDNGPKYVCVGFFKLTLETTEII